MFPLARHKTAQLVLPLTPGSCSLDSIQDTKPSNRTWGQAAALGNTTRHRQAGETHTAACFYTRPQHDTGTDWISATWTCLPLAELANQTVGLGARCSCVSGFVYVREEESTKERKKERPRKKEMKEYAYGVTLSGDGTDWLSKENTRGGCGAERHGRDRTREERGGGRDEPCCMSRQLGRPPSRQPHCCRLPACLSPRQLSEWRV